MWQLCSRLWQGKSGGESSLPTSDCQLSSVLPLSFTDLNLVPHGCPTVSAVPDNLMLAALPESCCSCEPAPRAISADFPPHHVLTCETHGMTLRKHTKYIGSITSAFHAKARGFTQGKGCRVASHIYQYSSHWVMHMTARRLSKEQARGREENRANIFHTSSSKFQGLGAIPVPPAKSGGTGVYCTTVVP